MKSFRDILYSQNADAYFGNSQMRVLFAICDELDKRVEIVATHKNENNGEA